MFSHYLMFNGCCSAAIDAYAAAFGAQVVEKQTYGDLPDTPLAQAEAVKDLVLHARLTCPGGELMCADSIDRHRPGTNQYITVTTPNEAYVRQAWAVLSQDAEIYMDLAPTFFAGAH
ncbi:MAG: hypothetical protein LBE83_02700, partial [Propionibacteriaceae bacterium]|nr:hypothetical protein [Propionibacteriaceae bacterium]